MVMVLDIDCNSCGNTCSFSRSVKLSHSAAMDEDGNSDGDVNDGATVVLAVPLRYCATACFARLKSEKLCTLSGTTT
jgi:hypothetical protein